MMEYQDNCRILVLQGNHADRGLPASLAGDGFRLECVPAGQPAIERLARGEPPALVLMDLEGPETLTALRRMVEHDQTIPIIVTAEPDQTGLLIEALQSGAYNFLIRPVDHDDLLALLQRSNGYGHQASPSVCQDRLAEDLWYVAASPAMLKIRQQITQIAPADVPVFINGESGVGKEVIARMIHELSDRSGEAFIKVNCAALPGELLESELFGYEQGAFTGAVRPKPGKFESASRGTIFLDEIAEMAPHLQAKLLHVLQDSQFSRLGGRSTIHSDVRVLAATNTPVQQAIREGRFRKDLYYRLSVFTLYVPPLRERSVEIPLLFRHFVEKYNRKYAKCSAQPPRYLLDAASRYAWPGNLRELENLVKRYVILGDAEETFRELLDLCRFEHHLAVEESPAAATRDLKARVRDRKDETELEAILEALDNTRWCRKHAAQQLGISYKALLYKMRRFHLDGGPGSRSPAAAVGARSSEGTGSA